ncbi:hypothetical protein [Paenibacillus campinasensis]|uniref:hypothetical protein n=1 Tax=Paenibacillus campinasensis TaxID=66347 RepID=UPI0015CE3805|nr:hypothetical protein [Paenibacillus campinasensis]
MNILLIGKLLASWFGDKVNAFPHKFTLTVKVYWEGSKRPFKLDKNAKPLTVKPYKARI